MNLIDNPPERFFAGRGDARSIIDYDELTRAVSAARAGDLPEWLGAWCERRDERRAWGEFSPDQMERFLREALYVVGGVARAYSLPTRPGTMFPRRWRQRTTWAEALRIEGYTSGCRPADRPAGPVTLYRGGARRRERGLSWTPNLDVAAYYARVDRGPGGKLSHARPIGAGYVWRAEVSPDAILADLLTHGEYCYSGVEVLVDPSAPELLEVELGRVSLPCRGFSGRVRSRESDAGVDR